MRTALIKAIALRANLEHVPFQHSRTRVIYAEGSALQCIHCCMPSSPVLFAALLFLFSTLFDTAISTSFNISNKNVFTLV